MMINHSTIHLFQGVAAPPSLPVIPGFRTRRYAITQARPAWWVQTASSSVSLGIYHDCVNRRHRLEIIIQDFSIAHTFYSHIFGWYFDAWLFWLQPVELPIGWWCHCGHALIWSQNGCQCIWCRQEGAFLFWVLSRRHYFTSPQNGIIPFFRHSRTSPVDGTFRLFWWIPVKHMVLRSWDVNFVCIAKVDQVAPKA